MRLIVLITCLGVAVPVGAEPSYRHDMPNELGQSTTIPYRLRELRIQEAVEKGELTPEQAKLLRKQLKRWPQQPLPSRSLQEASEPQLPPRPAPKHFKRWRQQQDQQLEQPDLPDLQIP